MRTNSPFRSLLVLLVLLAAGAGLPAQAHGDKLLIGYWHNWPNVPNSFKLSAVPDAYDVINVAFAVPTAPLGATVQFTPDPSIYPTTQAFITDVKALQAKGRKVLISVGGANGPIQLLSPMDETAFVNSMTTIINTYGFDGMDIDLEGQSLVLLPGDTNFRQPTTPSIVHLISALTTLLNKMPASFMLTAAPETSMVQGGFTTYAGVWGAYLPIIHAFRNRWSYVAVQHYNTGSMFGRDGNLYNAGSVDFHVAMADMLLAGFVVDKFTVNMAFPPLSPEQVVIGLPASPLAANTGYTQPASVHGALDHLILGDKGLHTYNLGQPKGYPAFRGLMTWSINWDVAAQKAFSNPHRAYLDTVFLGCDVTSLPFKTGGKATFTLRGGLANSSRSYLLLASLGGTAPGSPLPGSSLVFPLNLDLLSRLVIQHPNSLVFSGFLGSLDTRGQTQAVLNLPALPGALGVHLDFAWFVYNPFALVSGPVGIDLK